MAFKLIEAAQERWRAVNAPHLVALVRAGARFECGKLVEGDPVLEATQAADDSPRGPTEEVRKKYVAIRVSQNSESNPRVDAIQHSEWWIVRPGTGLPML
jgi:hypothetical protein